MTLVDKQGENYESKKETMSLIKEFNELANIYKKYGKEVNKLCDIFCNAFESPLVTCTWKMFDTAIELLAEKHDINTNYLFDLVLGYKIIFIEQSKNVVITDITELINYLKKERNYEPNQ